MNLDRRLLQEARLVRALLGLAVAAGMLGGVATVLQARYLSATVGAVFLSGSGLEGVSRLLALLLLAGLARAALVGLRERASGAAARRVKERVRDRAFAGLQARGPARLSGERTGEVASTLVEGVEGLDAYYSQYLPSLALAVLVPLGILAFVFPVDPLTGVIFLLTGPLVPVFMILIGRLADQETRRQWSLLSQLSAHFLDVLQGLPTLKIFGRSKRQAEVVAELSRQYGEVTLRVLRIAFLSALVLELLSTISTAVVAVEVGLRLLYGRMPFEEAFFLLVLAPEFYQPLRALGTSFHAGLSGASAAKRIFGLLGGAAEGDDDSPEPSYGHQDAAGGCHPRYGHYPETKVPSLSEPYRSHGGQSRRLALAGARIEFHEVGYAYAEDGEPALREVSFSIEPGARVALVGPSGAGKSTITAFLLRFRRPTAGEIRVGGRSLDEIPPADWRRLVAWVPERPHLFHGTVAENIRLARPGATPAEVVAAATAASADEFIRSLPNGYETQIGDEGARLSGGQAQRIALARAFLKRDAELLVLDEATSHLDSRSEAEVQKAIERLSRGRTTLVIAHRLSTVRSADQILVLDGGRLVERGTHGSLASREGLYRELLTARHGVAPFADASPTPEPSNAVHPGESAVGGALVAPLGARRDTPFGGENTPAAGDKPPRYGPSLPEAAALRQPLGEAAPGGPERRRSGLSVVLRLLALVLPFWPRVALAVLLGALTIGSGMGLLGISAYIIATAALHPSVADLQIAIVGVRFLGLSRGVFRYLERYTSHLVTFRLLRRLHVWLYEALEPLAPARLLQYRGGDLLSRIVADVQTLEHFYVRVVAPPAVALVVGVGAWLLFDRYDAALAWALALFLALAGVGLPALARRLGEGPSRRVVGARAELSARVVDGIQGMADLLAFGRAGSQRERVAEASGTLDRAHEHHSRATALSAALQSFLMSAGVVAVLGLAVPLVEAGRLSGIDLAVLAVVTLAAFEAVFPLPIALQHLEGCVEAGRRLLDLVDARPAVQDPAAPLPPPVACDLEARDLTFSYDSAGPLVLDGVSFALRPGETLAVVGPSGAGKSTIVSLLARFWNYEGEIRLGGRDLREYRQEDVRRLIAIATQRPHLFNATVRDNLKLARAEAADEDVWEALRLSQLDAFVRSLPEGLDTRVGEHGTRLSGGERQRLAIARALLRDAPILVLDEPTANLDAVTGRAMLEAIRESRPDRALLIVTHQVTSLADEDDVLVLVGGRVVERGRHAELLRRRGAYREIWEEQAGDLSRRSPSSPGRAAEPSAGHR